MILLLRWIWLLHVFDDPLYDPVTQGTIKRHNMVSEKLVRKVFVSWTLQKALRKLQSVFWALQPEVNIHLCVIHYLHLVNVIIVSMILQSNLVHLHAWKSVWIGHTNWHFFQFFVSWDRWLSAGCTFDWVSFCCNVKLQRRMRSRYESMVGETCYTLEQASVKHITT
jgi:hypothetical protein